MKTKLITAEGKKREVKYDLKRTSEVLGTLISWLDQELSRETSAQLLNKLQGITPLPSGKKGKCK